MYERDNQIFNLNINFIKEKQAIVSICASSKTCTNAMLDHQKREGKGFHITKQHRYMMTFWITMKHLKKRESTFFFMLVCPKCNFWTAKLSFWTQLNKYYFVFLQYGSKWCQNLVVENILTRCYCCVTKGCMERMTHSLQIWNLIVDWQNM